MPLALFVGVNQHYQFLLLGCAFLSDESPATFTWLMQTWVKAMGGNAPKVIITDQDREMKSVIAEVFPNTRHSFCLWHIMGKLSENFGHLIKQHENFKTKFEKCIYRSWTEEKFETKWQKFVNRFELKEDVWFQSLHEDRKHWVPTFMKDTFLAGMSTAQRSESVNSFFDKYVHKKTTVQEFVKMYEDILKDRYEEEAKADTDTWNKQPALKSPSPLEKHMSGLYTHAVFKKFQAEVVGVVACHPKKERQDETTITYIVREVEKNQNFIVTWNELKSEVSCMCRSFEYKGYLCRHALIVLQISALSHIPSHNILKRWTKDAKRSPVVSDVNEQRLSRVQRYNDLCQRAMKLGEEGSLSQESYEIAFRSLEEALENCASVHNSSKDFAEAHVSAPHGLLCNEEDSQSRGLNKTNKKKNPTKKRKIASDAEVMGSGVQENLQQMDKVRSRAVNLDWNYNAPTVQGMVQLNLMAAPTHNNFNAYQPTNPCLGQLNPLPSGQDTFYTAGMPCVEQMNFFGPSTSFYGVREDPNIRPPHLPHDGSRHPQ